MELKGRWALEIHTPIGIQQVELDVRTGEDGGLQGTATRGQEVLALEQIEVDEEGRVSWVQHVRRPLRLTLRFEVELLESTMSGIARAGVFPASRVEGRRIS